MQHDDHVAQWRLYRWLEQEVAFIRRDIHNINPHEPYLTTWDGERFVLVQKAWSEVQQ